MIDVGDLVYIPSHVRFHKYDSETLVSDVRTLSDKERGHFLVVGKTPSTDQIRVLHLGVVWHVNSSDVYPTTNEMKK